MSYIALGVVVAVVVLVAGCVRFSGGTWMVKEAPLPAGWPELTPVGTVEVKHYPNYRAAVVDDESFPPEQRPMFMALFDHIKRREIAMTTPVEMGYRNGDSPQREMSSMAFIYREPTWGTLGVDGKVIVRDVQPQTMASVGVRGSYTNERFRENLALLDAWVDENADAYRVTGSPRYLGYNGPFTFPFMRYGEVQLPVEQIHGVAEQGP